MVETRQIAGRAVAFRHESGAGPSLVCVHGSADNHHVYDRLLDAMPGRDRYAINLPGRAGTDGPALGTAAEMEAFLSRFVESELDGNYLVVGHSLGGAVAIEHALSSRSAGLVGIVLLATGARLRVHPMILQLFEQVAKSGAAIPPLPPGLYQQGTDPELVEEASKHRELTPIETAGTDWRAANSFDRMQDLPKIRVPALIVAGTQDALTPAKYAHYLAAEIPNSDLHILGGAGHMLVMERAAELAELLSQRV
ncbi:MAG: alpha/beta hydrolase [Deltaproteobacteria bacterium]|nr:alpha/beta hydrolase [Deltaproteobacteria bacterium]NND30122.1 alpha/beta hydrolase [Myxococcales bacterium]MBT8465040.1 alpha/beta hydrolase [Deltaproteobacteria bacterium]MBT8482249.1 alpha/beta hydrolase [Deltaproteobacteria bacterium]NNK08531.1 alpha/beta hydrolase [Myxococcales bacterium]